MSGPTVQRRHSKFSTTVSLRIPARKQRRNSRKGKRVVLCASLGRAFAGYIHVWGHMCKYKSTVPQKDIASKQKELDVEANALISRGGKVSAALLPFEEACKPCGDCLPDYIAKVILYLFKIPSHIGPLKF
ncbi:hypothetical protein TB2_021512 [Malus domestica]